MWSAWFVRPHLVITGANHGLARCGTMGSTAYVSGVDSRTSRGAFLERSAVVGDSGMESAVRPTESLGVHGQGGTLEAVNDGAVVTDKPASMPKKGNSDCCGHENEKVPVPS